MPTRPSKKRRNQLDDPIELARKIVDQATGDAPKEAAPDPYEGKNRAARRVGQAGWQQGREGAHGQSHGRAAQGYREEGGKDALGRQALVGVVWWR
ncbi:MAG TPA: hypothetical protein VHC22_06960 [Pirellulales bacterium]|nr:hypothetical protein [Pirellulales bacterium]